MGTDVLKKPAQEKGEEQQEEKFENKERPMTPEQFEGAVDSAKQTVTSAMDTGIEGAKISFAKVSEGVDQEDQTLVGETSTALEGVAQDMLVLRDETKGKIDVAAGVLETKETEKPVEIPKEIAEKLITDALDQVRASFNAPENDEQRLDFHNTAHTEGVVGRTEQIMRAIQGENVNEREVMLAKIIAAGHDIKQEYGVDETGGKKTRKRSGESKDAEGKTVKNIQHGTNEKESAVAVVKMMEETNRQQEEKGNPAIFSEADFKTAKEAIDATVPGWDPKANTVMQPSLTAESSAIARALALADLGEAGMDTEGYLAGGDALFREDNLDMWDLDIAQLTNDQKVAYTKRMLGWSALQVGFARGRQQRLEKEIAGLPEEAQKNIKELFSDKNFNKSIEGAQAKLDARAGMDFATLYQDMGFKAKAAA